MEYVEITVEEAMKRCNKNAKVLVAIQDLEKEYTNVIFIRKKRNEYSELFEDIQTVTSFYSDFVKQLNLFTEKQNIYDIKQKGLQKIILLKE